MRFRAFLFGLLFCWIGAFAWAATTESWNGDPAPAELGSGGQIVGALPYSNPWASEQRQALLYLSYNTGTLANTVLKIGQYDSSFDSNSFASGSIDYFGKIVPLAPAESKSALRRVSIWGRYGVGFGVREGTLSTTAFEISSASRKTSLFIADLKASGLVSWDSLWWVQPYAGFQVVPLFYRHNAGLNSAEAEGTGLLYGPVVGAHFPVLFGRKVSVYGEAWDNLAAVDSNSVLAGGLSLDLGLGVVF